MIEPEHPSLSVVRQCELVSISRSSFYYQPVGETTETLALMRLIDAQFLETPWYGSRQMARHLRRDGHEVGRKRVRRLMAVMGLVPIYQRPRTTVPNSEHRVWPYLLRGMMIDRPNQVWCMDITEILSANSGGLSQGCKARHTRFGPGPPVQPVHDPRYVHRGGRADLLQPSFGQADISAPAHAERAHALRERALDPGPHAVAPLPCGVMHPRPCRSQRLVFRARVEVEGPARVL